MSWASLADDLAVTCRDVFGVAASLRRIDPDTGLPGVPEEIVAIFDTPPRTVDAGNSVGVTSGRPCLTVRLADLSFLPEDGDLVTARESEWRIVEVEQDGHGSARLYLHEGSGQ